MSWTKERVQAKLAEISASIPENLRKNAVREVKATPTMEMVMKKAVTMEKIPLTKRRQIQTLLDNGDFSKMKIAENSRITKMIDNYVSRKINEAIKSGQLPPRNEIKRLGLDKI